MNANDRTEWIFNLLALNSGRVIVKSVIGFNDYETARNFAFSLVPKAAGPLTVKSYM
jgi:hypothetical protein